MRIATKRLIIRPYTENDEQAMIALLTNDLIKKTYMIPDLTTRQEETKMFMKLLSWSQSEEHLELGIYLDASLIGFINDVKADAKVIELGYVIHPHFHGMGYATAGKLITAFIFQSNRLLPSMDDAELLGIVAYWWFFSISPKGWSLLTLHPIECILKSKAREPLETLRSAGFCSFILRYEYANIQIFQCNAVI